MKQLLVILFTLISVQTLAQDTTKIVELERIVISPVRANKKVPITQKTIGNESIQESYHGQEIPMILGSFPSIYSNSDGGHAQGYTYFTLRGATQNRLNMTLNGVPLNEAEDHGVYFSNFPSLINSVQSIQIQRGVGTSSYGTSSFVGSLNFQTKNGFVRGSEMQIGVGSYDLGRFNFSTSTGLNKKNYALFANIGGMKTDGFRENSGGHGGSVFVSGGYFGDKRVTKLTLFSGISENKMAWEGSLESDLERNFKDNPRGKDAMDKFSQTHIQLHNTNIFRDKSRLTSIFFYNRLNGKYDIFNLKDIQVNEYFAQTNQYSNWFGVINQYERKDKNITTTYGVSLNTFKRNHFGRETYGDLSTYDFKNNGVKNDASVFFKTLYEKKRFIGYGDIQYRYAEFIYTGDVKLGKQTWSFLNPKLGVKYLIDDNIGVYTNIGLSHREPTRNVMFNGSFYLIDGEFNKVAPERVLNYELGTNLKTDKVTLQGNIFLMYFRNEFMPLGGPTLTSLARFINVDKSFRGGVEFDLEYKMTEDFSYTANLTLSRNTFGNDNKTSLFSPSVLFNQSLSWVVEDLWINFTNSYFSKAYIDLTNDNSVPSYTVFGLNASYQLKTTKIILQLNNLNGSKYYCNAYVDELGNKRLFPNALTNFNLSFVTKL